eukprot:6213884-Pleurochrysis_carterae.AAC.3
MHTSQKEEEHGNVAPKVSHRQAFTAICADEVIHGISPATRSDASARQLEAMFYVFAAATDTPY